ncbi:MAG: amidohydrolase [Sphingobacteriales bacterium]|nr:amidohydrolase [Sphingobacteriales bacterium]
MQLKKWLFNGVVLIFFAACNNATQTTTATNDTTKATMYYGGDIITMEGDNATYAESIVVKDGKIIFVGGKDEAMKAAGDGHNMIDLQGKTMLPGFIDGHSHLLTIADGTMQANLSPAPVGTVASVPDIISALKELKTKQQFSDTSLLIGWGYDQDFLSEKRHPTAAELDAAFPTNPVVLIHTSGHMLVANTLAFKLAGVSAATKDPTGGTFIRKKGSNELEGLVQEMAMVSFMPLTKAVLSDEQEFKKLKAAQEYYASCGVTTAAEHLVTLEKMPLLAKAAAANLLFIDLEAAPSFQMAKELLGTGKITWGAFNNHLKYCGLKIATDGSPQGKTAFLTKPYLTPVPGCSHDCKGFPNLTQEQINELMLGCYSNKVQLYSHCNGDASIDMMISGHEYAMRKLNDSTSDRRTVIIHSQIMRPDQLATYKKYKMLPSFFTNHTFYWGDVHIANLGMERASFLSPMKSAMDMGIIATNHTDASVTPMDQLFLLWSSVNRLSRNGVVVGEAQRIDAYHGLKALTINGAYQYFEENTKGSLKAGKLADLVILDKNPLKVNAMTIKDIKVMETIKEGKSIYKK